jgi:hypothetical protein
MKTPTENTATPQEPQGNGCMARLVSLLIAELKAEHDEHPTVYAADRRVRALLLTAAQTLELIQTEPLLSEDKIKIVQIMMTPNDSTWQGRMLGLGSDGVTYHCYGDKWEPFIPSLANIIKSPTSGE